MIHEADRILAIISQAWGSDDNEGYCFFPWVEGPDRKFQSKSFYWPDDRPEILEHMIAHVDDDLYWCPMLFSENKRRTEVAREEYCLWADLDEADPRKIDKRWRPSVAWETSPGRYQALWLLEDPEAEDLYGASQRGADNQRMTLMVDADPSGWDTTQLLRLPGWTNHKAQYEVDGEFPAGKLLWNRKGPRYTSSDFNDLPAIPDNVDELPIDTDLFDTIEGVEAERVLNRVKHELPKATLARMEAGPQEGEDRSGPMYYFMRCLGDVGCSVAEIVAVIRPTRWNKFRGRPTELDELVREATKAWNKRKKQLRDEVSYEGVTADQFIRTAKSPDWLVRDMLVKGNVGFIGGEPKARKSWVALDLAMSVAATSRGYETPFLDKFRVMHGGPVLYFVLEDGQYLFTQRMKQIWEAKTKYDGTGLIPSSPGVLYWTPKAAHKMNIPLTIVHNQRVNLSDPDCVAMIHQRIRQGTTYSDGSKAKFALVLIDTLMRATGTADINSMGEMMNGILDPLTRIAKREGTTILLVHHFGKARVDGEVRGGTRLLGSQALHAWAEDSLYLTAQTHGFKMELESKTAPSNRWDFATDPTQRTWAPRHVLDVGGQVHDIDFTNVTDPKPRKERVSHPPAALVVMRKLDPRPHTTKELAEKLQWSPGNVHRAMNRLLDKGYVVKVGTAWQLTPQTVDA